MEDILISELPLYTGETTGTYILINNSGETETFKVLREVFLNPTTSGNTDNLGGSNMRTIYSRTNVIKYNVGT